MSDTPADDALQLRRLRNQSAIYEAMIERAKHDGTEISQAIRDRVADNAPRIRELEERLAQSNG